MNIIKGKMFSDNGMKIKLSDLLAKIPKNEWTWCIYEFEGVGVAPFGLSMPEFEDLVLSKDTGFEFTQKAVTITKDIVTGLTIHATYTDYEEQQTGGAANDETGTSYNFGVTASF